MPRQPAKTQSRPPAAVRPADFDIRYRRLLDDLLEVSQMGIAAGRCGQTAALLAAERSLAAARNVFEARRKST